MRRIEDPALLTGAGRFVDDLSLPGQAHLRFLRSPHAHARIRSIDVSPAASMPGVLAVVTGRDLVDAGVRATPLGKAFRRGDGAPAASPPRRALAHEVVRFVGEAVAAVIAETPGQASDALSRIEVDYEELPAVVDPVAALAPGAPRVCAEAPDNLCAEARHGNAAEAAAAFARAAHVVSLEIVNQRLAPTPIEPRGMLASYDPETDRLTARISGQMPTAVRNGLADELGIPREKVRVLVGDVGGGFGMKTGLYPEYVAVAWCARSLQRPVKWCAERGEELLAATHGRDLRSRAELALDGEGRALALRVSSLANVGAYPSVAGIAIQLLIGPWVSTSVYDIGVVDLELRAVLTHTGTVAPYRGAGRPEAIYLVERLMDAAARELGMDPAELRRRNLIRPEQMPYRNAMGQTYDCGRFESVLDRGLALADWDGFEARRAASARRGRLRGRGIATFLEWTGGNAFEERVAVEVSGDGEIEIVSATQAMGQGIATTYAQLAVDVFGVPIERIRIVQGDTDRANGFGSAGSRSLFTGGSAIRVASEQAVRQGRDLAAEELEAAAGDVEYRDGVFRVVGTDRAVGLFELAARQPSRRIAVDSTSSVSGPTWPNGCHVCEVEVDPETGQVEIASYSSVNDVGRVVNPAIVVGQLDGGAVQGIGQALCEEFAYDPASGQALTGSLLGYALPRAEMAPGFRTELDESTPTAMNPLGAKGVGELGTIGATPAVVNAVVDALASSGLGRAAEAVQMPLTPARVWQALHRGAGRPT
ncbi:MAG TPA: xanthine dehydrogenase family protein molybdopterin-binding subunit [Anaeromyxobacteraceae bacterium]|nr:xanthine dehydrogenase family protein molybdopterin-binding subunit [Anaeromyxobacteraceae bacterium]